MRGGGRPTALARREKASPATGGGKIGGQEIREGKR